jgi:hypothetical protein
VVAFGDEEAKRRKHVGLAFEQGKAFGEEIGRLSAETDLLKVWIKIMGDMNTQVRELIEQGQDDAQAGYYIAVCGIQREAMELFTAILTDEETAD